MILVKYVNLYEHTIWVWTETLYTSGSMFKKNVAGDVFIVM